MSLKEEEEELWWREQVSRAACLIALTLWVVGIVLGLCYYGGTP